MLSVTNLPTAPEAATNARSSNVVRNKADNVKADNRVKKASAINAGMITVKNVTKASVAIHKIARSTKPVRNPACAACGTG